MPTTTAVMEHRRAEDDNLKVGRPLYEFIIGFIAGFCAAIFPRLTSLLLISDGDASLDILHTGYLLTSALFATLIGAVIASMEWGVLREPRTTFMAALGIPAIITGSFNTVDGLNELDKQTQQTAELSTQLQHYLNVPVNSINLNSIESLSNSFDQSSIPLSNGFELISSAHAEGFKSYMQPQQQLFNPSINANKNKYIIILDKSDSRASAIARAKELNRFIPAEAIATGGQYLVIRKGPPTNKTQALIEALKIRTETQLLTEVLELH